MKKKHKMFVGKALPHGNVFINWELRDGKFSSSGEIWDKQGYDCVSAGQNIDQIAEMFPDSEQVFMINLISERYHLNDMIPGSPKQMELINSVIDPEYRLLRAGNEAHNTEFYKTKASVIKRMSVAKIARWQTDSMLWGYLESFLKSQKMKHEDVLSKRHARKVAPGIRTFMETPISRVYIYPHIVSCTSDFGSGAKAFSLRQEEKIILTAGPRETIDHYAYVKARLKDFGRLHDPDYIVDGKAYSYGSKWLREELPEEVIEEINSWVEVPLTVLTPLQQLALDHGAEVFFGKWDHKREQQHYELVIGKYRFDFWAGSGVTRVTPEQILGCLLSDYECTIGMSFDDAVEYFIEDLGFDYKKAKKCVDDINENSDKLKELGIL